MLDLAEALLETLLLEDDRRIIFRGTEALETILIIFVRNNALRENLDEESEKVIDRISEKLDLLISKLRCERALTGVLSFYFRDNGPDQR